jgi:hypothetical protein
LLVTVAIDEDMKSPEHVATQGHSSDGRFGDVTKEPLQQRVTRCSLLQLDPHVATVTFVVVGVGDKGRARPRNQGLRVPVLGWGWGTSVDWEAALGTVAKWHWRRPTKSSSVLFE